MTCRSALVVVSLLLLGSCIESKSCTLVSCIDSASLAFVTEDATWRAGDYEIGIDVDAAAYSCTARLPDALPQDATTRAVPCTPELDLYFTPLMNCQRESERTPLACQAVSGAWELTAALDGTPRRVAVSVRRDGAVVAERSETLEYRQHSPNGPECGPTCSIARMELTLP